ncbi:MAG: GTPase [Planctomycetota bacterium]
MKSSTSHCDETIAAIATPEVAAPRGVIRISGPATEQVLIVCGLLKEQERSESSGVPVRQPRRFACELFVNEELGRVPVDVLFWPGRQSYTSEPSAEVHTFGAPCLLAEILDALHRGGARPAKPGEFTLRAFLAGRLDLTQAEAVLGVIDADNERQLHQALHQLAGNLGRHFEAVRCDLLNLLADIEAGLDFVEEDIAFVDDETIRRELERLTALVHDAMTRLRDRDESSSVFRVVLRGMPNAGKSSLLNALSGGEFALVSHQAGTTRDIVRVQIDVDGRVIELIDTAGIERQESGSAASAIIAQAQMLAEKAATQAHACVLCLSADSLPEAARDVDGKAADLIVVTKSDLVDKSDLMDGAAQSRVRESQRPGQAIFASSLTGEGLIEIRDKLAVLHDQVDRQERGDGIGTAVRCRDSLVRSKAALDAAMHCLRGNSGHELVAGELRLAADAIGEITGQVYTDDILDRVFSRFCIGK